MDAGEWVKPIPKEQVMHLPGWIMKLSGDRTVSGQDSGKSDKTPKEQTFKVNLSGRWTEHGIL